MHPLEQIAADEQLIEELEDRLDRLAFRHADLIATTSALLKEAVTFTPMTQAQADWIRRANAFISTTFPATQGVTL